MIKAIIPNNPEFLLYKDELQKMYEKNQVKICDSNSFNFIIHNTLFYCFTGEDGALTGAVYFFQENGKLYLNAFAGRKHFDLNIACLKLATTWFNCDIYAEAQNRASALCLLKAGFKRVEGKLFVFKHK